MGTLTDFAERLAAPAETRTIGRRQIVDHYGDPVTEYHAMERAGGICQREDRTTLRVAGRDRASWLHNLTTNEVKKLTPGHWRYAFVLTVKGRILCDLNLLVDEDCIWLDLDDRFVPAALSHFSKYTIVEDVAVADVSDQFSRLTVLGPKGVEAISVLFADKFSASEPSAPGEPPGLSRRSPDAVDTSATHIAAPAWTWTRSVFQGSTILTWRNPAWGVEALDLIVPTIPHSEFRIPHSLTPVGWSALETRRIEAGIPASVSELNEEALPAETGQLDRAVSFNKGCYLGQEVVERMRAHKSLGRKLVGIVFEVVDQNPPRQVGGPGVSLPVPIQIDGKSAGTLTSICNSPKLNRVIGLGYVRAAQSAPGTSVRIGDHSATVAALPFV